MVNSLCIGYHILTFIICNIILTYKELQLIYISTCACIVIIQFNII